MKILLFISFGFISLNLLAQKHTFDVLSFTPPKGWSKETKEGIISYTKANNTKKTWCRINIFKSTASKGNIQTDFASEWTELIEKTCKATDSAQAGDITELKGWKVKTGIGKFTFNNAGAISILTTFSGFGKCASVVALTNSETYLPEIEKMLASADLKKTAANDVITSPVKPVQPSVTKKDGYTFTTTNFDDGWTSVAMEDWVEVTKGNITLLIHYPNKTTNEYIPDGNKALLIAWDNVVAPRYSNLKNFKTAYINTSDYPHLAMGSAVENAGGKEVFIVFFRQGKTGWLEFVSPDKKSFIQSFKFDPETIQWNSESDLLKPLAQMASYNKFAVAASDFSGTWTSDFSALHDMYNIYTGNYAATTINQSKETFNFSGNGTYSWHLIVVSGYVGNAKFNQAKSNGKITVVNNWQVSCSDIEGKPKKYYAYFSCIKGARLLNLLDADYPGTGMYTVYGLKTK